MSTFREPTVAEVIEQLAEMPQHYPATIIVNGMVGVITGVWCQAIEEGGFGTPTVLIGERDVADPIVPAKWSEAVR